jgi:hypothetical protein
MLCQPSVAPPAGVKRPPAAPRARAAVALVDCSNAHPRGTRTVAVTRATPLAGRVSVRQATAGRRPVVVRAMAAEGAGKELSAQVGASDSECTPSSSLHATSRAIALVRDPTPGDWTRCWSRLSQSSCPTMAGNWRGQ